MKLLILKNNLSHYSFSSSGFLADRNKPQEDSESRMPPPSETNTNENTTDTDTDRESDHANINQKKRSLEKDELEKKVYI